MATLELKYSADQKRQVEAVEAITDLFRGQGFLRSKFTAEAGAAGTLMEGQVLSVGHANGLRLSASRLLENLHDIQEENSLPATNVLLDGKLRDFTIDVRQRDGSQKRKAVTVRTHDSLYDKGGGNNNIRVSDAERTKIRCARRRFEAIESDVEYDVRTTHHTVSI